MHAGALSFHHMGLAVSGKQKALQFLQSQGYEISEALFDPAQGVDLLMCVHATMPDVELIYNETETDTYSPIQGLLKGRNEMIYHLCYSAVDIKASVDELRTAGMRLLPVVPKKPAVLFGGKSVAFYYVDGFGLIEIIEEGVE